MVNSVAIYFYGNDDVEILHINAPCQPFKVGDIIDLQVKNNDKEQWCAEKVDQKVIIQKIESRISLTYGRNGIIEHLDFFLSVGFV